MKLKIYLLTKNMSIAALSRKLRCTRDHLSRVINGKSRASKKLAEDIEAAIDGYMSKQEIIDCYKGDK